LGCRNGENEKLNLKKNQDVSWEDYVRQNEKSVNENNQNVDERCNCNIKRRGENEKKRKKKDQSMNECMGGEVNDWLTKEKLEMIFLFHICNFSSSLCL
jgi:hypothetical protein